LTAAIRRFLDAELATPIFAFALLLLIPYAVMKLIENRLVNSGRVSVLSPVDRVLGFGFGALKGTVIVVVAFALLVLGYDATWGYKGRPAWITTARTYPIVNASVNDLVQIIAERREILRQQHEANQ